MHRLKTTILLLISISFLLQLNAQTSVIDSLENLLLIHTKEDTIRVNLLNEMAYEQNTIDSLFIFAKKAEKIAKKIHYIKGKAVCYHLIGVYYQFTSDYPQALEYFKKSLELSKKAGLKQEMSNSLLSTAITYNYLSNYPKALEYYQKSMKISEELEDKDGVSSCLNNIGLIYHLQGDLSLALEYYQKALIKAEEFGDKQGTLTTLSNIGSICFEQSNYLKALEYFQEALKIAKEFKDKYGISKNLTNIGSIQLEQGNYSQAMEYFEKSMVINKEHRELNYLCVSYFFIGKTYFKQGNYPKALNYTLKSLKMTKELELLGEQKDNYEQLSYIYSNTKNYKKAYENYILYKKLNDSIFNGDNIRKITKLDNQYAFDKEKQAIKLEQQKKDTIQAEETKRQKIVRNSFIAGFVLMLILVVVVFRNFQQKRKANLILNTQKEEIQTQAEELQTTNEKLTELNSFKEEMTGMIVHDLKNPLNSIINLAENKTVVQSGKQMLNMIMNILDVYKYKETKIMINKSDYSLLELSENAINEVFFLAEQKNIKITNEITNKTSIKADKEITERIFVNILTNAIKYTPINGKITITTDTPQDTSQHTKINISDTGQGIPKDQIHLIFEKYGQITAKKSGKIRSTGLGLTFCKMAVEAHGGEIGVESELEKGTKFWFTLPVGKNLKQQEILEVKTQINEELNLSELDKDILKPYISKLQNLMVYEISEVNGIIKKINIEDSDMLKKWKKEIENAVFTMNEEKYKELIHFKI